MLRPAATLKRTTRKRENHKDSNYVSCLNYIIHYAKIYNNSYSRFQKVNITHLDISSEG